MKRRTYLGAAGAGALAATAGCLGVLGGADANPNVVLGPPDRENDVSSEDLPYPAWGQRVPDVTLPAALSDEPVALREVDRPAVYTFFYTHCMTVCPAAVGMLRELQIHSVQNGYAEEVAFHPTTFDPARDDAGALRAYADRLNVALDAGNWRFLRPADPERAASVVTDEFGVFFEKEPKEDGPYMFTHLGLVVLANGDGYVERAYRGTLRSGEGLTIDRERVRKDLNRVRTA
jgi:protein SCO1/2